MVLTGSVRLHIQSTVLLKQGNGKRKHANGGSAEKVPRLEIPASPVPGVRRSARRGRLHDEVKITVSSAQTLRELKMQVPYHVFMSLFTL